MLLKPAGNTPVSKLEESITVLWVCKERLSSIHGRFQYDSLHSLKSRKKTYRRAVNVVNTDGIVELNALDASDNDLECTGKLYGAKIATA